MADKIVKKKIKNLTKLEAERYFCNRYKECEKGCPLYRQIGCKMDPFCKDYDEQEVELVTRKDKKDE